jgi:hypothetical protein
MLATGYICYVLETYLCSLSLFALESLFRDFLAHFLGTDADADHEESGHWIKMDLRG